MKLLQNRNGNIIQLLRYQKMTRIWNPLPPCLHLVDIGKPPVPQTFKTLHQPPPTPYKKSLLNDFIV